MMMNWDLIPQWKRHAQNCIDFCLFFTVFAELCNRNNSFWYWCFVFLWHFLSVLLIFLFLNSLMTVFSPNVSFHSCNLTGILIYWLFLVQLKQNLKNLSMYCWRYFLKFSRENV